MRRRKNGRILTRMDIIFIASFVLAVAVILFGGFNEKESLETVGIVLTMSVTMAGFGLVAFQVAHASNALKKDFIESSIILILSTLSSFFYLLYPERTVAGANFGEIGMFLFIWGFIILLMILVDRRLDVLK